MAQKHKLDLSDEESCSKCGRIGSTFPEIVTRTQEPTLDFVSQKESEPLLDLTRFPPELREMIYDFAFTNFQMWNSIGNRSKTPPKHMSRSGLPGFWPFEVDSTYYIAVRRVGLNIILEMDTYMLKHRVVNVYIISGLNPDGEIEDYELLSPIRDRVRSRSQIVD